VFDIVFEPQHGTSVVVADQISRVTAPNASPYTFHGTNSYIVGRQLLGIIDPGPNDDQHLKTLLSTIAGRTVTHIFVTHTHIDHSPLTAQLKALTGATVVAYGPHIRAREMSLDEERYSDASSDLNFVPDIFLKHREAISNTEWIMRGVFTPGHTANHMAFALEGTGVLFSGDHVMAWATTIIAPPDGSMNDYLDSLDVLLGRDDSVYFPGHGGPVRKPKMFVRALKNHRLMREASILERLKKGDKTIAEIVNALYRDIDSRLHGAAALTVLAHLERLVGLGRAQCQGPLQMSGHFIRVE
jgi:glyoxylase-like metal-dependent hydrolase (beta-lactamase superfamily II)